MKEWKRAIKAIFLVTIFGGWWGVQAADNLNPLPLPACAFTPSITPASTFICDGDSVVLTANAGNYTYQWYRNGVVLTNDTLVSYQAMDAATYKVIINDTALGCIDSTSYTLNNGATPSLLITFSDTSVCLNDDVNLTASGADTLTWSGGISNGVSFAGTTSQWYYLTGKDSTGCPSQDSIFVEVFPLPTLSIVVADDSVCLKDATTLTASGAQTFLWTQQVSNGVSFTPSSTKQYNVIGTDSNGCKNSDSTTVVVLSLPNLNLGSDTSICPYDSIPLQAPTTFIEQYLWSDLSTGSSIQAADTGSYHVTVTDSNGCVVRDTLILSHDTLPESAMIAIDSICDGDQYTLSAQVISTYSYLWSKDSISSPTINLSAAGDYLLTVTDQNGCFQVDTFNLFVLSLPVVGYSSTIPDQCTNNSPLALTQGTPSGGSYSSTSPLIANDTLWPTSAGVIPVTYSFTDTFNCTNTADTSVVINSLPVVNLQSIPSLCLNGEVDTITENSPKGGHFFSTLIWVDDTGYIDPTSNAAGTYQVAYSYTDAGTGCTDTAYNTLIIHDTIGLSFTAASWCENESLQLIGEATGIPGNLTGVYSGTSVQSGSWFDPSVGFGSYDLTYQLTDSNSCLSTATRTVTVDSIPLIQFSVADICANADATQISALPGGGTFSGTGLFAGDSLDPGVPAVGLNTLTYAYTDLSTTCSDTVSASYSVFAIPVVTFQLPDSVVEQCVLSDSVFLSGNSPVGGVFSGVGLTTNNTVFNPDTAGVGSHEVVYTYTDANNCVNSDKDTIEVYNRPVLTFSFPDSLCFNSGGFALSGATPVGGTYSGLGVDSNGIFDPVAAGLSNNHSIHYHYLDTVTGCDNDITETYRVDSVTYITLGLIPDYCLNYDRDTLSQGSFHTTGFKYEGFGIVNNNAFDPPTAGVGNGTVSYIYTNSFNCSDTAQQMVTVHGLPTVDVNIPVAYQNWCQNDGLIPLNFATPSGGIYSAVAGISGNSFNPQNASLGNNDLIYTYTDTNNCQHADTSIINIKSIPVVSVVPDTFCFNDGYLTLSSGIPSGGFYQGPGMVSNTIFNPAIAGVGNKTIKYTYTAPNGCSEFANTTYKVDAVPIVSFASPASICLDAGIDSLVGATTNGSSSFFYGNGIINNTPNFDPSAAGVGSHLIGFVGVSSDGCRDTVSQFRVVDSVPVVNMGAIPDYCSSAASFQLTQGSPAANGSGVYTGNGVTGSFFNPQLVNTGQHKIFYTFTDLNGCDAVDSTTIQVDTLPIVSMKFLPTLCKGGDTLQLDTFGVPQGGSFSGPGVQSSTSQFSPSNVGTSQITYTFSDSKGCSGSSSQFITVNALPSVSLIFPGQFCENAGVQPLQGGFPPLGGSYRGLGVINGFYIPDSVQASADTLYYIYQDAFGCTDSAFKAIRIDSLQEIETTPVPDLCKGDGAVDLEPYTTPKGGSFSGISVFGNQFVPNLLDTGTYFYLYTLTDTNNCTSQIIDTIHIRPIPDLQTTSDPSICVGESVTLTATGGLSYNWSNGDFGSPISLTPSNSQSLQVETVNEFNCKAVKTINITVFDRYQVFTTGLPADCGVANGSGVISASGGKSPYSFFWSDGDRNSVNRNLNAGTYLVTVVDNNNCTEYATVNISNRNGPSIALDSLRNNNCHGDSEGYLKVSASGGSGTLSYNWSNGFQTDSLTGLPAGKYDLTVVDEKGCLGVRTYEIKEGAAIEIESSITEPICDSASGLITVNAVSSGAGYTYSWVNQPAGDSLKEAVPGIYLLAIEDTNQCVDTVQFELSTASVPEVRIDSILTTLCGLDTGAIFSTPLDTAYRYDWSTGDTTVFIDSLSAGKYSVSVSDSLGCVWVEEFEVVQEAPAPVDICFVTNDTVHGQNVVLWDTTGVTGVTEYVVYRESGIQGNFFELGRIASGQAPELRDSTLQNHTLTGNYRVAVVDACSMESKDETLHRSILMAGERINGGGIQLNWSNYLGISVTQYYVYRFTTSNGLELLDSVGTSFPTYTDYSAPAKEDEIYLYYFVSADPLKSCHPAHQMILSNYTFNFGTGPPNGVVEYANDWNMKLWPNPNNGEFTVRLTGQSQHPMTIRIFDQQGRIHREEHLSQLPETRDFSIKLYDISAGVYYLQAVSNGYVKTVRVSINP